MESSNLDRSLIRTIICQHRYDYQLLIIAFALEKLRKFNEAFLMYNKAL